MYHKQENQSRKQSAQAPVLYVSFDLNFVFGVAFGIAESRQKCAITSLPRYFDVRENFQNFGLALLI